MPENPSGRTPIAVASIVVQLLDTGQIALHGALDNPLMAIGMLQTAQHQLLKMVTEFEDQKIVQPPPGMRL